ncbi:MAG: secretin N-terminal domain-containing protein [Planctomycetota bacterium]
MAHRKTLRFGRFAAVLGAFVAFGLAPGAAVPAEESAPATASASEGKPLRVNLSLKGEDLSVVVRQIREQTGINIIPDQEIEKEKVEIDVTDLLVENVLDILKEKVKGLEVEKVSGNFYRLHRPPTVSVNFAGAPIQDVMKLIASLSGRNIILAPTVQGQVTMNLRNVPWEEALRTVAMNYNYAVVKSGGGLYSVVDPRTLVAQSQTQTFRLRFIQPPSAYRPKVKSEIALGSPAAPSEDYKISFPLFRALNSVLSPAGKIEFDRDTNSFIVTDIPTKLNEIAKIVTELDKRPSQVLVDVKFIQTNDEAGVDFGVKWEKGLKAKLTGASVPSRLPFTAGKGGWEDSITPYGEEDDTDFEGPAPVDPHVSTLEVPKAVWGLLDFTETILTLQMLQTRKDVTISQAPKIVTVDNQESTIFIGESVRYAEAQVQAGTGGSTIITGIAEGRSSPVNVGFQLLIQPHIIPETGEILLTLIPEENVLSGTGENISGFDTFTAAGATIDLPRIATRSIVTKVLLQSGQTVVIGGMNTESKSESWYEVPIISKIPLLGWLFKSRSVTNVKRKLTIFVTVDIVRDTDSAEKYVDQRLGRQAQAASAPPVAAPAATPVVPVPPPAPEAPK